MVADGGVLLVESVGGFVLVGGCAIIAADINTVTNKREILGKDNCIVIVFINDSRYVKQWFCRSYNKILYKRFKYGDEIR